MDPICLNFVPNHFFEQFQTSCDAFGRPIPWGLIRGGGGLGKQAQRAPLPQVGPRALLFLLGAFSTGSFQMIVVKEDSGREQWLDFPSAEYYYPPMVSRGLVCTAMSRYGHGWLLAETADRKYANSNDQFHFTVVPKALGVAPGRLDLARGMARGKWRAYAFSSRLQNNQISGLRLGEGYAACCRAHSTDGWLVGGVVVVTKEAHGTDRWAVQAYVPWLHKWLDYPCCRWVEVPRLPITC